MTNTTEVIAKLRMAQVSSCSCLTKTPEVSWHDAACRYRAIAEAIDVITSPPELAELQATIADLQAEIERLKAKPVCIYWDEKDNSCSDIERLKGGQGEPVAWLTMCEASGLVEQAEPNEKASNPDHWSDAFPVFTSQPAPVSVPEGWKLVPIEPTEHMMKVARGLTLQQEQTPSAEYRAMVKSAPACLDKVKELNQ